MTDDRSHAVYTPTLLRWYDVIVLGVSNRLIWRCPTGCMLEFFNQHVSGNHLDVGVGTGYFLDRGRFPVDHPRVVLMDANPHCLASAARRIARYQPQTVLCDITRPIEYDGERFDSISLNYVLHCLPGALPQKAIVLDHLRPLLNPGGVLFGATLLAEGVGRTWAARRLMAIYNRRGIFGNAEDRLHDLRCELGRRFEGSSIHTMGCSALFTARG
jgi:ubiquinone/menaquinone biosynthesis C-methylase UbiE